MIKPKLSFCIPTCGRPDELCNLLRQILPQLEERSSEVELIIKDDSPDGMNLEAEKLFKKSGLSGYYYKGLKEGLDLANIFLATHAKGEYLWWCGDDEEVLPGAIEKIFDILKNRNVSFIFMNFLTFGNSRAANQGVDGLMNVDDFIQVAGTDMTLLSTGVFQREIGLKALKVAEKYVGTAFASQPFILSAMIGNRNSDKCVYFLGKPYLINHPTKLFIYLFFVISCNLKKFIH